MYYSQHNWNHPGVGAAYDAATNAGLYDGVDAETNENEFFAELTETCFWENDFSPYDNADLASHDPQGYAAVESAWAL